MQRKISSSYRKVKYFWSSKVLLIQYSWASRRSILENLNFWSTSIRSGVRVGLRWDSKWNNLWFINIFFSQQDMVFIKHFQFFKQPTVGIKWYLSWYRPIRSRSSDETFTRTWLWFRFTRNWWSNCWTKPNPKNEWIKQQTSSDWWFTTTE